MSHVQVNRDQVIPARPEDVYDILTDYKNKRQRILTPNFMEYAVEQGGKGPGTVVSYRLRAGGRERPYRLRIEEPNKGKVVTESDTDSSFVTTWTLAPMAGGKQTYVSVTSEWEGAHGIKGFFERTFAPLGLRKIYDTMLHQLFHEAGGEDAHFMVDAPADGGLKANLGLILGAFGVATIATVAVILLRQRGK